MGRRARTHPKQERPLCSRCRTNMETHLEEMSSGAKTGRCDVCCDCERASRPLITCKEVVSVSDDDMPAIKCGNLLPCTLHQACVALVGPDSKPCGLTQAQHVLGVFHAFTYDAPEQDERAAFEEWWASVSEREFGDGTRPDLYEQLAHEAWDYRAAMERTRRRS